jgi:hypothetical protein
VRAGGEVAGEGGRGRRGGCRRCAPAGRLVPGWGGRRGAAGGSAGGEVLQVVPADGRSGGGRKRRRRRRWILERRWRRGEKIRGERFGHVCPKLIKWTALPCARSLPCAARKPHGKVVELGFSALDVAVCWHTAVCRKLALCRVLAHGKDLFCTPPSFPLPACIL